MLLEYLHHVYVSQSFTRLHFSSGGREAEMLESRPSRPIVASTEMEVEGRTGSSAGFILVRGLCR